MTSIPNMIIIIVVHSVKSKSIELIPQVSTFCFLKSTSLNTFADFLYLVIGEIFFTTISFHPKSIECRLLLIELIDFIIQASLILILMLQL